MKKKSKFKKKPRHPAKRYFVVVQGKDKRIYKNYSQVREAAHAGASVKVFKSEKAALGYLKGVIINRPQSVNPF